MAAAVDPSHHYVTNHELKAALGELKIRLIKWLVGTGIAIAAIAATLAAVLARFMIPVVTTVAATP